MGVARLFGVCLAFLLAASVAQAVTIDLGPSDYREFGPNGAHTSGGIRSSFGQTVRLPPTSGNLTVTRNPVIPYGSVSTGLRNLVRVNPYSAAASAAAAGLFLAVDWAWDELTQEWVKYEMQCPVGSICAIDGQFVVNSMCGRDPYAINQFDQVKTVTASSGFTMGGVSYPAGTVVSLTVIPNAGGNAPSNWLANCVNRYPSGRWPNIEGRFPYLVGTIVTQPGELQQVPVPVDFSDLDAYLPSADPQLVSDAAGDVQRRIGEPLTGYHDTAMTGPSSVAGPSTTSTSTDPVTGETTVTNTSTQTNISYGDTTITTTNTTTSTTYQNGQQTDTTVTTDTPGELPVSAGSDWPGFCDWATVVCDWLIWTQEEPPPEQDLPQLVDDDFFEEKSISFGAKSCPPDYEINLAPFLETSVGVSFQPLCDFAGLIYYMVMAASYIIAAYISIGVARNG